MQLIISKNKIVRLFGTVCVGLFFLQNIAIGAQNSLELHSGIVKLIRNGKSVILQKAGDTYSLLANDRLQTGKDTQVSLYLKNRDHTVKLFSHSFFKLEDISDEGNSVALLIGKFNFSIKPLPESSGAEEAESENTEKEKAPEKKLKTKLGGKLKGSLAKLGKSKLRRKKKRFELRTVTAIIGVRGTKVIGETVPPITRIGATEGEVVFASAEDPDKPIIISEGEMSQVVEGFHPSEVVPLNSDGSMDGVVPGPAAAIRFLETVPEPYELLDMIAGIMSIIDDAESRIDGRKSKSLILSMTFTNR